MEDHLVKIKEAVIFGRHKEIEVLVQGTIDANVDIVQIVNDAMIVAMDIVGQKGLDLIKPLLKDEETESRGTIIMCTVKGDMHDIGKNLVIMMLEGAGFHIIDLGVDLTVEKLIQKVEETSPDILGLSALLTTTMPEMKKVIEALESKGLRKSIKIMVGGAPVDATFAGKIGADGFGKDAAEAVNLARRFVSIN